jgi:predicted alpha/beta-hydrolase family hydrolase
MKFFRAFLFAVLFAVLPLAATAQPESIGAVIMHGKGGSPTQLVAGLARSLESKGFLVANLEMPWSGKRNYDVSTTKGEEEVDAALNDLRAKGAKKVFIIGHSQGGVFALHLAGRLAADGVITIAPGGSTTNQYFAERIASSLARAREMVAAGKGNDPAGAMSEERAVKAVNPKMPILWVGPTRDYPGLIKTSLPLYRDLPKNPQTRLYEPNADHRGAPLASADEIARWMQEIAGAKP